MRRSWMGEVLMDGECGRAIEREVCGEGYQMVSKVAGIRGCDRQAGGNGVIAAGKGCRRLCL